MSKTYVIAEAAATHDGQLRWALDLVHLAADAGADAVKFQFCSNPGALARRRRIEEAGAYRRLAFPPHWLGLLTDEAHGRGIEFLCTTFLLQDIPVVAPYVDRFKVASLEADDHEFVRAHLGYDKPLFVSTGGMDMKAVHGLVVALRDTLRLTLMHCVAAYPAPVEAANLTAISAMRDLFVSVGYSDHTGDWRMGAMAVMAGASAVEVHCYHDRTSQENPDRSGHAHNGRDLRDYIQYLRWAETVRGDGIKRVTAGEVALLPHRVRP